MEAYLLFLIPLLGGWLLDKMLGDPRWMPHPVVLFGKLIAWGDKRLNRGPHRVLKGGALAVALIAATFVGTWALIAAGYRYGGRWGILVPTLLIWLCLAGRTLVREVRDVFYACSRSLSEGRRQVARIVGRDTNLLSADEVRAAALETLAENLSDGVVAPLFWYAFLGVPGMMAYKMINTLDSMIGYRNARYLRFGRVAARIDDVANYIPARLTAYLMLAVSGRRSLISFVRRYGRCHKSPNSGYPEAALAGILDCRFGGTHNYFGQPVEKPYIGTNPRPLTMDDYRSSAFVAQRTEAMAVMLAAMAGIVYLLFIIP